MCTWYIQLPLDAKGCIEGVYHQNILQNPQLTMMNMAAAAGGNQNPELGILLHCNGAMAAAFSIEQFLTQYLELYYELELEVISHCLCATYLGTLTPVLTQSEVTNCKQICFERSMGKFIHCAALEYYKDFMSHVCTMPRGILYPLDIGATFFNNLSSEIKKMMESGTFEIPQHPHPNVNVVADDRVLAIRDQAIQVEAHLKVLKLAASRYGAAPSAHGSGAQSFLALPPGMDGMDQHNLMEIIGPEACAELQMEQLQ